MAEPTTAKKWAWTKKKAAETGFTIEQVEVLDLVPETFSVFEAAKKRGVDPTDVRIWLANDSNFVAAVDIARETALDLLEGDVYQRAIGRKRKRDRTMHKASDFLAVTILKTYKPNTWGANPDIRIDSRSSKLEIRLQKDEIDD